MSFEKFVEECSVGDKHILAISVCVRCYGVGMTGRHTVRLACLAKGRGGVSWVETTGMNFGPHWEDTVLDILPTTVDSSIGGLQEYLDWQQVPMTSDVSWVDSIEKLHKERER